MCELEPGRRRAPGRRFEAQRFRYLQKVNDLEISTPGGEIGADRTRGTPTSAKLIELLDTHAEIKFESLRSKLGLRRPKGSDSDYSFNLEAGGEKRLKGQRHGGQTAEGAGRRL